MAANIHATGLLLAIACAGCHGARTPRSETENRLDFCVLRQTMFKRGEVDELRVAAKQDDLERLWHEMRGRALHPGSLSTTSPRIDFRSFFSVLFTRKPDGCGRDVVGLTYAASGALRVYYSEGDRICWAGSEDDLMGTLLLVSRVGVAPANIQTIESTATILDSKPSNEDSFIWKRLCSEIMSRSFSAAQKNDGTK